MSGSAAAIAMRDVSFARGGAPVLDGLSLTIDAGATVALVGRSGAGKTTILKLINGLLMPDRGAVTIDGRDTREWEPYALRRRIGYVLQEVALFPHMTVADNVAVVPRLCGWDDTRVQQRIASLLDRREESIDVHVQDGALGGAGRVRGRLRGRQGRSAAARDTSCVPR